MGLFKSTISRIRQGLAKTRRSLTGSLRSILLGRALSDEIIDEIEAHLITGSTAC